MKTVTEIRMPSLADKLYLDENIETTIPIHSCGLMWAEYCSQRPFFSPTWRGEELKHFSLVKMNFGHDEYRLLAKVNKSSQEGILFNVSFV